MMVSRPGSWITRQPEVSPVVASRSRSLCMTECCRLAGVEGWSLERGTCNLVRPPVKTGDLERWPSGRRRSPAKRVGGSRSLEGSNPSLSARVHAVGLAGPKSGIRAFGRRLPSSHLSSGRPWRSSISRIVRSARSLVCSAVPKPRRKSIFTKGGWRSPLPSTTTSRRSGDEHRRPEPGSSRPQGTARRSKDNPTVSQLTSTPGPGSNT